MKNPIIISLDIETTGLHHLIDKITIIGIYTILNNKEIKKTFKTTDDLAKFLKEFPEDYCLLGHNLKFDLKFLHANGLNLLDKWAHDTMLMSVAYSNKIPKDWLDAYEVARKATNKALKAAVHREVGPHSLKALYPYFCDGEPFWETADHADDEYVLKDCEYTYKLYHKLLPKLMNEDTYSFYQQKLMNWNKVLFNAEIRGARLDIELLKNKKINHNITIDKLKIDLLNRWAPYSQEYLEIQLDELRNKYKEMEIKATEKNPARVAAVQQKYADLFNKAAQKVNKTLNIDSPAQINWLFKRLNYNLLDEEGDETTGKAVLERLILEGKDDVALFQQYKKAKKLVTSFYDAYLNVIVEDKIHTSFNLSGTRTGRLSSANVNLQQVPKDLHSIFIPRKGYKLATLDLSGIEPNIIAYFSEDKNLCELLIAGNDFHSTVTKALLEEITCDVTEIKKNHPDLRALIKQIDLSLFYGSGVNRMKTTSLNHGFNWDDKECYYRLKKFKKLFSGVFEFKKELDNMLIDGFVPNILGRPIRIEDPTDIYMKGFNTLIQSSASDLVLQSAQDIMDEFAKKDIDGHLLILVHDELVIEVPEDKASICEEIIVRNMTKYPLKTIHGDILLKVEGHISDYWEK